METAKAFHYRWCDWLEEHPRLRAQMIAHEAIKGMRDTYHLEQREAVVAVGGDRPKTAAPWDVIRDKFFK